VVCKRDGIAFDGAVWGCWMMVVVVVLPLLGEATRAAKDGLKGAGDGIGSVYC
jgi:hypothetical protein